MSTWYHDHGGVQNGPLTLEELREGLRLGRVLADDRAWSPELAAWTPIRDLPQLMSDSPPPAPRVPPPMPGVQSAPLLSTEDLLERPVSITLLAVYEVLVAALMGIAALIMIAAGFGSDAADMGVLKVIGLVAGGGSLLMGAAGLGLFGLRPYARILSMILAVPSLLAFPFGTFIGIVILALLSRPAVVLLFRRPAPEEVTPEQAAALTKFRTSGAWTTLIAVALGLNVVLVPMVGIVSAIAIPNLLNAIQRGKQKRTMGDMRTIATAVESYSIDMNQYPAAESLEDVRSHLEPTYIKSLPMLDGWSGAFQFSSTETGYQLRSLAKDGVQGGPAGDNPEGPTANFNDDIRFADGSFVAYPEGTQE